jgi:hypothetical protein
MSLRIISLEYCKKWSRSDRRYYEALTEDEARKKHESRDYYTAVVLSFGKPKVFLEWFPDGVNVGFLDEHLRNYLTYTFSEKEPGRLFLSQLSHREKYKGDSNEILVGSSMTIRVDGHVFASTTNCEEDYREKGETKMDVSQLWEPYPEFGEYLGLIKKDRIPEDSA